ncbi:hypothetical protein [Pararhizobium mangrovi]|uniref:Uncharacterized protein n=1 Tax=Pararhizobium mangrovi TaxID=2590452 RepID=A0A506U0A7_9HYPH|nr:hypothetical protein [Pararhizobium mangrovi]TPW26405.1 hypothetical protein FJU11_15130 [Pararhizobium mangrovi]
MPSRQNAKFFAYHPGTSSLSIAGRTISLPKNRFARISVGCLFVLGGIFSFLPVLGIWMLPLGLLILSQDFAFVRRHRRKFAVRWSRWRQRRAGQQQG